MYSNNIYAVLFFVILRLAPLISAADGSQLSLDYYKKTCPYLQEIVWSGVWKAAVNDSRMPASLLRLHFHDCFVNGCDASVLLDDTPAKQGEKSAPPNKNSLRGFEVIDNIKKDVETWCPYKKIVSCADILALAARAAVKLSLHVDQPWYRYLYDHSEPWDVPLGRLDGMTSNQTGASSDIPSPFGSVDTLITKFAAKGLNVSDLVLLSGAHTIGMAQCSTFKSSRLYPAKGSSSSTMDPKLLSTLKGICPNNKTSDKITVAMDRQTKFVFDNEYYNNLVNKAGILKTDQDLASDKRTSRLVNEYKDNQEDFFKDFGAAMEKMGKIGVITKGSKIKGEIRNKCGSTNYN